MFRNVLLLTLLILCSGQNTSKQQEQSLTVLLQELFPSNRTEFSSTISFDPLSCTTGKGVAGQCLPPTSCISGNAPENVNYEGECPDVNDVCCPKDKTMKAPQRIKCGYANPQTGTAQNPSDMKTTKFPEYPWIVAILHLKNNSMTYTCSGSLIHPSVVMTTAHKIYELSDLKIRAGEWDMSSVDEALPHQERDVERVIVHTAYNYKRINLHNDIALLVINKPVDITSNVNTLCLPSETQPPAPGTKCFSTGWVNYNQERKDADLGLSIPKKVEVSVIDHAMCQKKLRRSRVGPFFKLDKSFICTDVKHNENACIGDGGSPLMCPVPDERDRFMASGMVAWDVNCNKYPTVYADVGYLKPWVDEEMDKLGYSTDTYTI